MTLQAISAETALTEDGFQEGLAVLHEDGRIVDLVPVASLPPGVSIEHFENGALVPGFFDIQVNGGGGLLFNHAPTQATLRTMSEAHAAYGSAAMLPTLITDDLDKVSAAIDAVAGAIENHMPGIMGIHLEGPFLNTAKKGIHDGSKIQRLEPAHIDVLSALDVGVTLVTLAPEETDPSLIEALVARGVVVSAGHTNASFDQMQAGLDAGITGFTHLYNAMSPLQGRSPGAVGAALAADHAFVGMIPDGHHVHPASLKVAVKAKGVGSCMIVTDAMSTTGSDQTSFRLNGEDISLNGGRLTNDAGTLAGSALDMAAAVHYMADTVGAGLEAACLMASRSPANFMGLSGHLGRLAVGQKAALTVLDDQGIAVKTVSQPYL